MISRITSCLFNQFGEAKINSSWLGNFSFHTITINCWGWISGYCFFLQLKSLLLVAKTKLGGSFFLLRRWPARYGRWCAITTSARRTSTFSFKWRWLRCSGPTRGCRSTWFSSGSTKKSTQSQWRISSDSNSTFFLDYSRMPIQCRVFT